MVIVVLCLDASSIYLKKYLYKGKPNPMTVPSVEIHRRFPGEEYLIWFRPR